MAFLNQGWCHSPSPSCLPLAIPVPRLLSAPWECVINICGVSHLELAPGKDQCLATSRAPFLRGRGSRDRTSSYVPSRQASHRPSNPPPWLEPLIPKTHAYSNAGSGVPAKAVVGPHLGRVLSGHLGIQVGLAVSKSAREAQNPREPGAEEEEGSWARGRY